MVYRFNSPFGTAMMGRWVQGYGDVEVTRWDDSQAYAPNWYVVSDGYGTIAICRNMIAAKRWAERALAQGKRDYRSSRHPRLEYRDPQTGRYPRIAFDT